MVMRRFPLLIGAFVAAGSTLVLGARGQSTDEDVARRQLDSGRSFSRQGNYAEALKDFRAVADTHPNTSVADDALLEIARYYLDVAGNMVEANTAVDAILKKYPTSDSAPSAYVIAGRLALARGHQAADLEGALANFDRVPRLFPASEAVAPSLVYAAQAEWYGGRLDDALANLERVEVDYRSDPAAPLAYLTAARVLVSMGDPVSAMEALQQVRNRWPTSPEASKALAQLSLLYRVYVKASSGNAFALSPDTAGPPKLENGLAVVVTGRNAVYWASEQGLGVAAPADAERPPSAVKPRGITVDRDGNLVVIDSGDLRPVKGTTVSLAAPKGSSDISPLQHIDAAVQLSNGDWAVMDGDQRSILRFKATGEYISAFSTPHVTRLALSPLDEVAGLDRDAKCIDLFDASGKQTGKIPFKGANYDLQNPEDLRYDNFGHLYVLDRTTIAVFTPYPATPGAKPPVDRGAAFRLVTAFTDAAPTGFKKATAFAVDASGTIFLYDDHAQRLMVYR
jgi:TolA-binding protein